MRVRRCKRCYIDIYRNPEDPCHSRIPIDTCLHNVEEFVLDKICMAKDCGCPRCDFDRNMYRKIQEILQEYKKMKMEQKKHPKPKYVNNH